MDHICGWDITLNFFSFSSEHLIYSVCCFRAEKLEIWTLPANTKKYAKKNLDTRPLLKKNLDTKKKPYFGMALFTYVV